MIDFHVKKNNFLYIIFIFVLLFIIFPGCKKKGNETKPSNKKSLEKCINSTLPSPHKQKKIAKEINADSKKHSIDTFFQRNVNAGFNGAVLVEQRGVLLYKNAKGLSNLRTKDSLNFSSTFQLASISKIFTGVAVLQLVEKGKIHLNDTIQKFIPKFPYHGITVGNLLSHRSGLPNYLYSFEDKRRENAIPPDNKGLIDWFITADPQIKPEAFPNRKFQYNNTNYAVLARIVEIVTKKPFASYMRDKIFLPVGMKSTYIDTIAPPELLQTKVTGYDGRRERTREIWDGVYGDKGMYSNVDDMLKWYHALRSGCLVSKALLDSAFIPRSVESPSRHNYGYGFRLMSNRHDMSKVHYVYHGGWWNGFTNMFWMDYEHDFVIILLSNKRNRNSYNVKPIIQILDNLSPEEYDAKFFSALDDL